MATVPQAERASAKPRKWLPKNTTRCASVYTIEGGGRRVYHVNYATVEEAQRVFDALEASGRKAYASEWTSLAPGGVSVEEGRR